MRTIAAGVFGNPAAIFGTVHSWLVLLAPLGIALVGLMFAVIGLSFTASIPIIDFYSYYWTMFLTVVIAELWRATALVFVILVAGLQSIPKDYEEAAAVFGAGTWARLRSKVAKAFVEKYAAIAVRETKKSGVFVLPGIGRLVRVDRKARMGRNPATGAAIKIPAKKVVKFRVAKSVKDAIVPPKKK